MELVVKELKYATFVFDEEDKKFKIIPTSLENPFCQMDFSEPVTRVVMNKTYAYAFMRFVLRFSQKALFRRLRRRR